MIPDADRFRGRRRELVLGALIVCYALNLVDRQLLAVLAGSIKADLRISDTQLGLMGGLAFALFYSVCGIPLAWLADRWNRANVIVLSLALWSLFTASCGLVRSPLQLFLCRFGVGAGEAGGLAPSCALIADYYGPGETARALGAYSAAAPLGVSIGILAGGLLANAFNWRVAFVGAGLFGLLYAPIFRRIVRDPSSGLRRALNGRGGADGAASARGPLRQLLVKPTFWLVSLGAGFSAMVMNGIIFWTPSFLQRSLGMSLAQRSLYFAAIMLVGGIAGLWMGGWLSDKLGGTKKAAYALVPAIGALLAIPLYFTAFSIRSAGIAFAFFVLPQALGFFYTAPVLTTMQHLVPRELRSTSTSMFLLINALMGVGVGIAAFGVISDFLTPRFGEQALKYSILVCLGFYVISVICFLLAAPRLRADWVE